MTRPIQAEISLSALAHNLAAAQRARPGCKVWAVIKARGYGHGLPSVLQAFAAADGFAVLDLEEAEAVRAFGWQRRVLLLEGFFTEADLAIVDALRLDATVHCEEQLQMLERCRLREPVTVHLKMNTGMNRLGFTPQHYRAAYARLRALPWVGNIAHMTHFAEADVQESPLLDMQRQMQIFETTLGDLPGERSVCNSAATLSGITLSADWIRPGIMLYGSSPFAHRSAAEFGLQPAMTLRSEIIAVQHLQPGSSVGYGSIFRAPQAMRIGVVACGYADGYPRHAPGSNQKNTPVLVDGRRTQMVGRVSMDMITVDLTALPHAGPGSAVTLWGEGLPVDEVAHAAGTIGYELLCALSVRVPVVTVGGRQSAVGSK